jgi:hypothetical protein
MTLPISRQQRRARSHRKLTTTHRRSEERGIGRPMIVGASKLMQARRHGTNTFQNLTNHSDVMIVMEQSRSLSILICQPASEMGGRRKGWTYGHGLARHVNRSILGSYRSFRDTAFNGRLDDRHTLRCNTEPPTIVTNLELAQKYIDNYAGPKTHLLERRFSEWESWRQDS